VLARDPDLEIFQRGVPELRAAVRPGFPVAVVVLAVSTNIPSHARMDLRIVVVTVASFGDVPLRSAAVVRSHLRIAEAISVRVQVAQAQLVHLPIAVVVDTIAHLLGLPMYSRISVVAVFAHRPAVPIAVQRVPPDGELAGRSEEQQAG